MCMQQKPKDILYKPPNYISKFKVEYISQVHRSLERNEHYFMRHFEWQRWHEKENRLLEKTYHRNINMFHEQDNGINLGWFQSYTNWDRMCEHFRKKLQK
jgi:hypothetical protein